VIVVLVEAASIKDGHYRVEALKSRSDGNIQVLLVPVGGHAQERFGILKPPDERRCDTRPNSSSPWWPFWWPDDHDVIMVGDVLDLRHMCYPCEHGKHDVIFITRL